MSFIRSIALDRMVQTEEDIVDASIFCGPELSKIRMNLSEFFFGKQSGGCHAHCLNSFLYSAMYCLADDSQEKSLDIPFR